MNRPCQFAILFDGYFYLNYNSEYTVSSYYSEEYGAWVYPIFLGFQKNYLLVALCGAAAVTALNLLIGPSLMISLYLISGLFWWECSVNHRLIQNTDFWLETDFLQYAYFIQLLQYIIILALLALLLAHIIQLVYLEDCSIISRSIRCMSIPLYLFSIFISLLTIVVVSITQGPFGIVFLFLCIFVSAGILHLKKKHPTFCGVMYALECIPFGFDGSENNDELWNPNPHDSFHFHKQIFTADLPKIPDKIDNSASDTMAVLPKAKHNDCSSEKGLRSFSPIGNAFFDRIEAFLPLEKREIVAKGIVAYLLDNNLFDVNHNLIIEQEMEFLDEMSPAETVCFFEFYEETLNGENRL